MDVASAELDQLCQGAVEIHAPSALSAGFRRRLKPNEGCGVARYNGLPGGGVPEWPKGTGCKPVGSAFRGSNPLSPTRRPAESTTTTSARSARRQGGVSAGALGL